MSSSGRSVPWPVALVGAGWLGRELARALHAQVGAPERDAVLATTRSGTWDGAEAPPFVDLHAWDNTRDDAESLRDHIAGARSMVVGWSSGGGDQDRHAVYVDGARKLLDAIDGQGIERIVYLSSTSALPAVDAWLDEDCSAWPVRERGRVQREAETLIAETLTERSVPWVVLRLGGLYGPGRELGRLYRRDPSKPLKGDGRTPTNLIHREDAVASVLAALTLDPDTSCIVHAVDDDHCTRREMYDRLAQCEGLEPPRWEAEGNADVIVGKRVGNRRLKRVLGVELRHPTHLPPEPSKGAAGDAAPPLRLLD